MSANNLPRRKWLRRGAGSSIPRHEKVKPLASTITQAEGFSCGIGVERPLFSIISGSQRADAPQWATITAVFTRKHSPTKCRQIVVFCSLCFRGRYYLQQRGWLTLGSFCHGICVVSSSFISHGDVTGTYIYICIRGEKNRKRNVFICSAPHPIFPMYRSLPFVPSRGAYTLGGPRLPCMCCLL